MALACFVLLTAFWPGSLARAAAPERSAALRAADVRILKEIAPSVAQGPSGNGRGGSVRVPAGTPGPVPAVLNTARSSGRDGLAALGLLVLVVTLGGLLAAGKKQRSAYNA
jgi:hypothetical protein